MIQVTSYLDILKIHKISSNKFNIKKLFISLYYNINNNKKKLSIMKLEKEEYDLLSKRLEFRFKNSGNELVEKLKNNEELSDSDITLLLKKLEYKFKNSDNELVKKLKKLVEA